MSSKPKLTIAPKGEYDTLPARSCLSALNTNASYHELRGRRHPLGVYNLSVSRISNKLAKCSDKLFMYWNSNSDINEIREEIVDYLELAMYAAAEHVDDIEYIANTFFKNSKESAKSKDIRKLKKLIKPLRDEIANFTNTIKHSHGRIRLYEAEFLHDKKNQKFLGFFIEGFINGAAGPNPILHTDNKTIISITSFLWSVLIYVGQISTEIANFLQRINAVNDDEIKIIDSSDFRDVALKMTRLPLYSFDDQHPFKRITLEINMDKEMYEIAKSSIYGSIQNQWTRSDVGKVCGSKCYYAGDGVTKNFKIVDPKMLSLSHWEQK